MVYGNPTPSDLLFMDSALFSFPASKASSTLSSTVSDAESAPPELDLLFHEICDKCAELVLLSNKQGKPEWSIPELIQALMGNEAVQIPGYPQDIYYDILLRGATSWFFQDLCHFIDLINYRIYRLKAGVSFLTIPRSSFIPPGFLSLFRKFRT